jgi:translation initiation factor 1
MMFGPYKDTSINMNWNTNVITTKVSGNAVALASDLKSAGGKTVTLVHGLTLPPEELATLGKQLRTACGAGGTHKDGVLEVQGDHVARVLAWLQAQGLKAKQSGG